MSPNNGDTLRYSPAANAPDDEQDIGDIDPITGTRESMGSDTSIVLSPDIEDKDITR